MMYWDRFGRYSPDELCILAACKRVSDLDFCDNDFSMALTRDVYQALDIARSYDEAIDSDLFIEAAKSVLVVKGESRCGGVYAEIWQDLLNFRESIFESALTMSATISNRAIRRWHLRQQNRTASELGAFARDIAHAVVCFELSSGCSVGCSFCGISAQRITKHHPYCNDTRDEFRSILKFLKEEFGSAAASGFLYWATDPLDNPNYMKFAKDFFDIIGVFPQVTTAIPLRTVATVNEILDFARGRSLGPNRFSLLTKNIFKRVVRTFSSADLLHVDLIPQYQANRIQKARAGRNINILEVDNACSNDGEPPSTIACVSGFIVNLAEKRLRLVSPTYASSEWPDGYIVFDDVTFSGPGDFAELARSMLFRNGELEISAQDTVGFRKDLQFQREGNGFSLKSKSVLHQFANYGELASVIMSGPTVNQVLDNSSYRDNTPGEELIVLRGLFEAGLICVRRIGSVF